MSSSSSHPIEERSRVDVDNLFDQLKSIKPFTVEQLFSLHPDVTYTCSQVSILSAQPSNLNQNLHQNLLEFERLRCKLAELKNQVVQLHEQFSAHVDNAWLFSEKTIRKIGMCQQGKIVETNFKYRQATINQQALDSLGLSFMQLSELISREYIYYSYESQARRLRIVEDLAKAYQSTSQENYHSQQDNTSEKLKSAIITLVDFIKLIGKSDFIPQCRNWLRCLIRKLLSTETTDNYRYVIAQLCRGPVGTADWACDLIECKPFDQVTGFESTPQYITHCCSLLTELFNNLKAKRNNVSDSSDATTGRMPLQPTNNDTWSLIDPRFNCCEEVNLCSPNTGNSLCESDILKFCLRIPVVQIFRAYVKECLDSNFSFQVESQESYEFIMLKLLTIGTIIIRTYQHGLETFNSIQFGNLIEYLSSQIRRTVMVLSDQWIAFKNQLSKQVDIALLLRLQVEYDNFILRSVSIILELRQSGLWKHLSSIEHEEEAREPLFDSNSWSTESFRPAIAKLLQTTGLSPLPSTTSSTKNATTPETSKSRKQQVSLPTSTNSGSLTYGFSVEWFREVSEPMLWHILWQLYHSAFVSLCDYHSDNYWLDKFKEKSSVYLFIKKIKDSSISECHYLLNSITSMLMSRTRHDSKIVSFIASEIFNMSFKNVETKDKISKIGFRFLMKSAEEFPSLISVYINYMIDEEFDENIVDLFRGCSLVGWLCNEDELEVLSKWLIDYDLSSVHSKVARLIITKLFLNSPSQRSTSTTQPAAMETRIYLTREQRKLAQSERHCFVDLRLRRKLALVLYETSIRHSPKTNELGPRSLGTFVEVALGNLYCDKNQVLNQSLLHTATEANYQQLYVWIWRLIFTFKLHILNQPETDWNDIQARSGTSRSIKNTVLVKDSFHPVPSLQDSECLSLSEGVKSRNPVALFVYLLMTDVTWQPDALDVCIDYLNAMVDSGHITPSLLAMKFFVICHLNELCTSLKGDPRYLHYFTRIIESSFDLTRFASLIRCQIQNVKQYRQLQLSQFYITILLEIAVNITKKFSASWFPSDEFSLEKIASLLDYIVKFGFSTQRSEIIKKFYDCSYSIQAGVTSIGWFNFPSNSLNVNQTRREFSNILHVLTQKFKKNIWLRWVTAECDTLKLEKIWEDIVVYLSTNENSNIDSALRKVCPQYHPSIVKSILPIYSWIQQIFDIVESDPRHPLCPLVWYSFFLNYFANSLNGVSVGVKIVPPETLSKLMTRLDSLYQYHLYKHRAWTSTNGQQNSLAQLYRAYRLWIQDSSLQDVYVDVDRLGQDYMVPLLKSVMEFSNDASACIQYIDLESIETQMKNLCQIWLTSTNLDNNFGTKEIGFFPLDESMEMIENEEASDAVSLISKPLEPIQENTRLIRQVEKELLDMTTSTIVPKEQYETTEDMINAIKMGFQTVLEESLLFKSNLYELDKIRSELTKLVEELYANKKREIVRFVGCNDETYCSGPGKITFEIEEATIDDRKSECIQDGQKQAENIVNELLVMPTNRAVKVSQEIESQIKLLMEDSSKAKTVIETLLGWISEPETYNQLNGPYYTSSNLLKSVLELLASSDETDTYNSVLIDVCSNHPGSVHIFSPHLAPSECSDECFLKLYEKVCSRLTQLGPMATFVLLTKFDLDSWLRRVYSKEKIHDLIRITCSALKEIGKYPDESYMTTYELFKRHIQVELAPPDRRKPEEITLLLQSFFVIMDAQRLEPDLLMEFMTILGLEKQSKSYISGSELEQEFEHPPNVLEALSVSLNECRGSLSETLDNVIALAENQRIFDDKSLNELIEMVSQFFNKVRESTLDATLLEVYKDYVNQLGIVLMTISVMWLKSVSQNYHNNHNIIWKKFMDLWHDWIFLDRNCQNVGKASYSLVAYLFTTSLRYMIFKMPDNTRPILQSVISTLSNYVASVQEVVYLELTILQRCLKNMPWASLSLSAQDFENIALLSEQENYNTSELVSHIMLQVNIKDSIAMLDPSDLPRICEKLATTIVLQSSYLKSFRLHGNWLTQVPVGGIKKIASLILTKLEFINLEHSQSNKLLVNLLRFICIKLDVNDTETSSNSNDDREDNYNRSVIYAQFVSEYLISLIKNHPIVMERNKAYLCAVMENSLQDLRILISPDTSVEKKTSIYGSLLECCSSNELPGEVRLFIAKALIESQFLKNRPIVVMEIFHSLGQILRDGRVLVYTIERMIGLYMNMNGHYEKVWKSFSLRAITSDIYLEACIQEMTPLALLVYFEASYRGGHQHQTSSSPDSVSFTEPLMNSSEIWSSFFHWVSKMSVMLSTIESKSAEYKLVTVWLRVLDLLKQDMEQFILAITNHQLITDDTPLEPSTSAEDTQPPNRKQQQQQMHLNSGHQALIEFIEQLIYLYDKYNSGGFWSYIKSTRTEYSSRLSIVALSVACFLSNRAFAHLGGSVLPQTSKQATAESSSNQQLTARNSYLLKLRDELAKLRGTCLNKLESARRLKHYLSHGQFIEALIESTNRNDKVQYCEAILLMINFVKSVYESVSSDEDMVCMSKILCPSR